MCVIICIYELLHHSSLLKETCVGQVALDKWLPLNVRGRRAFLQGQPPASVCTPSV